MARPSTPGPERAAGRLRAAAAEALAAVMGGMSLDEALPRAQAGFQSAPDRALLQRLCYGCLRDWRLLEQLLRGLLPRAPKERVLESLLIVGLYQLRSTRVPAHAAVSETVAAAGVLGSSRMRSLVNAVLRRYQRERSKREQDLPEDPAIRSSHPDWLVGRLQRDWPASWASVLEANQRQGPMTLRVNRRRITRDAWLQRLEREGLVALPTSYAADGVRLQQPLAVAELPGFAAGEVSVQDEAAQLAVDLLDLDGGLRVLDACAAPGGKAAHALERADIELLALDQDEGRLRRVEDNFSRLRLQAACVAADALRPQAWWDGRAFDRILLDAPCSGTGVIRRHPDIKWLRRPTDIPRLAAMQSGLLAALWPLLKPGGRLVYAVCSSLREEGEAVIEGFLGAQADAQAPSIEAAWGEAGRIGRRIAPGSADMDGFYYAVLSKQAAA